MKMKVTHRADENYLLAVIEGRLGMEAFDRAMQEMSALMDRLQCRTVLYDLRKVEVDLETHEIYYLPRRIREKGGIGVKRALVFPENYTQDFSFFETVASNQGVNAKIFIGESEALDWLLA